MLHTTGEELFIDVLAGARSRPTDTWYIGLYHSDDGLTDDDTYASVTTEPDYDGPRAVDWPSDIGTEAITSGTDTAGVYVVDVQAAIEFDTASAVDAVDRYYVAADFQSERLDQASVTRNLVWTHDLDQLYDLEGDDTFPLEGVRVGMD